MAVVTTTLLSESNKIDTLYELISIDIRRDINRIPYASLVLLDGDAAKRTFDLSNTEYFEPGKEIEVKLRYESETEDATVFKGLIVRHSVEANSQGSLLRIEMKDAAVKLTQSRKSAVFVEQDDAAVIGKLVNDSGLKAGVIDATQAKHKQIVQYYSTDWDFIVSRAESQGLLVVVEDGEVSVRKVDISAPPKHKFDYGIDNIYNFEYELDAGSQYADVQSQAWDVKTNKLTPETKAKPFTLEQGDLDGAGLADALGFESRQLSSITTLMPEELQAWADGRLMRSRLSMIRGRLETSGIADIKLFDVIEIDGIGTRFNGKNLVTGICHRVDVNGWSTDIQFGLSAQEFAQDNSIQAVSAGGLLPGISGLHIAVVDKFEEDPDKQYRVKVIVPGIDEKTGSLWARLANPDAGKSHGWFFRPETGDEVVVGFFNNDPRQPVILGAMYSPKNTPPESIPPVTKDNKDKAIVSKTGSSIGFTDDQKGVVYIKTAEGRKIQLDDKEKSMELSDQNGNAISMDANGITLKSAKDLKFEVAGNVEIMAARVDVK